MYIVRCWLYWSRDRPRRQPVGRHGVSRLWLEPIHDWRGGRAPVCTNHSLLLLYTQHTLLVCGPTVPFVSSGCCSFLRFYLPPFSQLSNVHTQRASELVTCLICALVVLWQRNSIDANFEISVECVGCLCVQVNLLPYQCYVAHYIDRITESLNNDVTLSTFEDLMYARILLRNILFCILVVLF